MGHNSAYVLNCTEKHWPLWGTQLRTVLCSRMGGAQSQHWHHRGVQRLWSRPQRLIFKCCMLQVKKLMRGKDEWVDKYHTVLMGFVNDCKNVPDQCGGPLVLPHDCMCCAQSHHYPANGRENWCLQCMCITARTNWARELQHVWFCKYKSLVDIADKDKCHIMNQKLAWLNDTIEEALSWTPVPLHDDVALHMRAWLSRVWAQSVGCDSILSLAKLLCS